MPCKIPHVEREIGQIPFDAHQEQILVGVLMLVRVQRVAVALVNEIVNRGVQAFLIGATD